MGNIKFRAREKKMATWHYGSFLNNTQYDFDCYIVDDDGNEFCSDYETVGQYTGLKDRHGVEIYEGDIVENNEELGVVNFQDGCFWISFDTWTNTINEFYSYEVEVVGNIHENPELLKG